jgi:hypothetical protein
MPIYRARDLAKVTDQANAVYIVIRGGFYYVGSTTKSLGNRLFKSNRGSLINGARQEALAIALPAGLTRRQVEAFETKVLIALGGKGEFSINSRWPVAEKFWQTLGIVR